MGDDSHFEFRRKILGKTEVWDGAFSWWSSQVCSGQSLGRRLRTFSRSRRKMSQQNPKFTVWPVGTGASRYHNCCIDGGTSPEYFGYHPVCNVPDLVLGLHDIEDEPDRFSRNISNQLATMLRNTPEEHLGGSLKPRKIQDDQDVSVHLMITTQKLTSNVQSDPRQFPNMFSRH
jgi:hypothetical protein